MGILLLATSNHGKVREFKRLLGDKFSIVTPTDPPAMEKAPRAPFVPETGLTYYENVLVKALRYWDVYGMPVLADDSGIEVDCLGGLPGVDSAVYGGQGISAAERWAHLLGNIGKTGAAQPWLARFRCVLCYYDGKNVPWYAEGTCEGKILPEPQGTEGFGYDPLFWSTELNQGFGSAPDELKNRVSHRARAVQAFLQEFALTSRG